MALYYYNLNGVMCATEDLSQIPEGVEYETNDNLSLSNSFTFDDQQKITSDSLSAFLSDLKNLKDQNYTLYQNALKGTYKDLSGIIYNASQQSSQAIYQAAQSAKILNQNTVIIYDINNDPQSLTIDDALNLSAQIQTQFQFIFQIYQFNKKLINSYLLINYYQPKFNYNQINTLVCDYNGRVWKNTQTGTSLGPSSIFNVEELQGTVSDNGLNWQYVETLSTIYSDIISLLKKYS